MRILILLILLWPVAVSAQEQSLFSVDINEKVSIAAFDNFSGNGQREICAQIYNKETYGYRLSFLDPKTQQVIANAPVPLAEPYDWYSADTDGNGVAEVVIFNSLQHPTGAPGFAIFQLSNGLLFHDTYDKFWGVFGKVGDVTGDGKDEIILHPLPEGYTNFGGTGPIDIQVVSRHKGQFELIASVSLPTMYLQTETADLNNNGRAEIIALKSGRREDQRNLLPPLLAVYSYTGQSELLLVDEVEIPMDYNDNLIRLWTQPLREGGYRIIVPIPAKYDADKPKQPIQEYHVFRFIDKQLIRETNPPQFPWQYTADAPLKNIPESYSMDIDNDGAPEVLQIRDERHLEWVKKPPSVLLNQ